MGDSARGLLVSLTSRNVGRLHADCVRSADGNAWADFTYDMARSRTFRWGEDGIAGVSDTHGRMHIAFAFWNEKE